MSFEILRFEEIVMGGKEVINKKVNFNAHPSGGWGVFTPEMWNIPEIVFVHAQTAGRKMY
ncbi:hypothetical protein DERP_008176 [Dermatophagoides pteronyssinus]|uniref:Uncharacterized protein n=1 Tax=Dermatophagoides pteronyssinus TaxID=6956 RepID=A0ABQ8JKE0_DERPT|nr:hypothetical protein DERP_008176 [Dermatophagoides pteronyssinus]